MESRILIVDDDPDIGRSLTKGLEQRGFVVSMAESAERGLELQREFQPDVVILDLELPGMHGIEALEFFGRQGPGTVVIILTGHGDIPSAVQAMRRGAEHFLTKPVEFEHLAAVVDKALEKAHLARLARELTDRLTPPADGFKALGSSPVMREVAKQVSLVTKAADTTVLLCGESGTGKGWLARLIHDRSPRAAKPFMDINCAGLSSSLLRSELFGHERGAFTDAKERKRGLLELAQGGTVFLDEIGDLALETQPKLLKVLEERRFRPLGGTREIRVDVQLIVATNQDLPTKVARGEFRQDLYYRLNVMPIELPALRERSKDDLLGLIGTIFVDLTRHMGARDAQLSTEVIERLCGYAWPGNVREMRNVLERALILAGGPQAGLLDVHHLPRELGGAGGALPAQPAPIYGTGTLEEIEARHIEATLKATDGNRTRTAEVLGVTRSTLLRKIRRYGLENVGRSD